MSLVRFRLWAPANAAERRRLFLWRRRRTALRALPRDVGVSALLPHARPNPCRGGSAGWRPPGAPSAGRTHARDSHDDRRRRRAGPSLLRSCALADASIGARATSPILEPCQRPGRKRALWTQVESCRVVVTDGHRFTQHLLSPGDDAVRSRDAHDRRCVDDGGGLTAIRPRSSQLATTHVLEDCHASL